MLLPPAEAVGKVQGVGEDAPLLSGGSCFCPLLLSPALWLAAGACAGPLQRDHEISRQQFLQHRHVRP